MLTLLSVVTSCRIQIRRYSRLCSPALYPACLRSVRTAAHGDSLLIFADRGIRRNVLQKVFPAHTFPMQARLMPQSRLPLSGWPEAPQGHQHREGQSWQRHTEAQDCRTEARAG